jgi:Tfp pilus assembly protein PilN
LLCAALLTGGYVAWTCEETLKELSALQAKRDGFLRVRYADRAPEKSTAAAPLRQAEINYANRVIDRLALPWDRLFNEMENTVDSQVVLLGVEPDAERGRISFTSEARDLSAMLSYERRLGGSALLRDVHVQSHQVQIQDPQRPVRFVVGATWLQGQAK